MLLFLNLVFAGEPNKKTTTIDFEAVDVEGQVRKPPGILTMERQKAKFNPLIQLKENFAIEIQDSIQQID